MTFRRLIVASSSASPVHVASFTFVIAVCVAGSGGGFNEEAFAGSGGGFNEDAFAGSGGGFNEDTYAGSGAGFNEDAFAGSGGGFNEATFTGSGGGFNEETFAGSGGGFNDDVLSGSGGGFNEETFSGSGGGFKEETFAGPVLEIMVGGGDFNVLPAAAGTVAEWCVVRDPLTLRRTCAADGTKFIGEEDCSVGGPEYCMAELFIFDSFAAGS
jgi:hypothetical protein